MDNNRNTENDRMIVYYLYGKANNRVQRTQDSGVKERKQESDVHPLLANSNKLSAIAFQPDRAELCFHSVYQPARHSSL